MLTKLLIVDDTEINRALLKEILNDEYECLEASDGSQALDVLSANDDISLILLDMIMEPMDGLTFLRIAHEKFSDLPPIIMISTDAEAENVSNAYNLGVTDYFQRPFNTAAILSRIRNTLQSSKKAKSDLEDALGMLSSMFYKILKVNLTTDTHKVISVIPEEISPDAGYDHTSISGWFKSFAEKGYVHIDDLEFYDEFTNIDRLRERFREGNDYLSCKYHRKVNDEYRWVLMEILKSSEYTDDNQIVVLYIRDVHEEYLRQKDEFLRLSSNAVKTSLVNLTANKVDYIYGTLTSRSGQLNCTIDEFVDDVSSKIPSKESAKKYHSLFNLKNLLKEYKKGVKNLSFDHPYLTENDEYYMIRTVVIMSNDTINDNIVGNFFAFDITQEYVNASLPKMLFDNSYWNISIINTHFSEVSYLNLNNQGQTISAPPIDYMTTMENICEQYVVSDERDLFRRRITFQHIQKRLESNNGTYEFTANCIDDDGNSKLYKYKYRHFNKALGFILCVVEDVTSLSEQDMLTGELNRQGFIKQAANILAGSAENQKFAILYMDIKRFKAINELFGAEIGDSILRMIPNHVSHSVLKPLVTARHTADRFVFLVDCDNLDYKELTSLSTIKYDANGKTIMVYLHCGIYLIEDKAMDINSMCNRATIAERFIDNEHIRPYAIFESHMSESYIDRSALYNALPDALANEEFQPYYQPIFDAQTSEVVSAEALVRWFHPQWGFMNPGLFVPALEEGGYISSVDLMIASHVQHFLEAREREHKPIVPVSINLSRMDFYDTEMMDALQSKLSLTSLDKGFHRFEVTESSYMAITETDVSRLDTLRSLGAKILIDDFGSGYSSFGTIADYDFDIIKLDMAFVQKIGKNSKIESIIHSLIDMAHHMDAKVIAEGAETKAQVEFLRRHNCDYIQGYYFSKPLSEKDFTELLDNSPIKTFKPTAHKTIRTQFITTNEKGTDSPNPPATSGDGQTTNSSNGGFNFL